jgi:hypothetical protein
MVHPVSPRNNVNPLDFLTEQTASTSDSAHVHESHVAQDPLAEFYDLAKAERDNDVRSGLLYFYVWPLTSTTVFGI